MDVSSWVVFFASVGLLSLLRHAAPLVSWLRRHLLLPPKDLKATYGSWALVTGATDGIGKSVALELARCGLNLLLLGRDPSKLRSVSDQITNAAQQHIKVRTVVADLARDLDGGIGRLREAVEGLDVGVVVNNAGTTYPSAMYFHEVGEEVWEGVVRVNLLGMTMVTWAVLPGMLKRGRGAVVCVGSGAAAAIPSHPLFAVYAATKAYVAQFSRSVHVEYKKSGIDVQCQIPMYVMTKMAPHNGTSFFVPSPDDYAQAAVRRIGHEARCTPYWTHSLQWWLASLVPESMLDAWRLQHGIKRRRKTMEGEEGQQGVGKKNGAMHIYSSSSKFG